MGFDYLDLSVQACPLCGGSDFSGLNKNDRYFMGLHTVGCNQCGLIQMNPRPSEIGLGLFYSKDYRRFYQGTAQPGEEYIRRHNKYERLGYTVSYLKTLADFGQSSVVLDVGCSEGTFFSVLRERGFLGELYGVELNSEFARYAELNNRAKVGSTLDGLEVSCDLIVVNHVLEHFLDPKKFLRNVRRLMKEGGILYIDVPDADEYKSLADLHIAHICHYTVRTLSILVETCGFDVVLCEKHTPPFHPKSIRLVAKNNGGRSMNLTISVIGEAFTWSRVKNISPFARRMKILVRSLPFVRRIYLMLKKSSAS